MEDSSTKLIAAVVAVVLLAAISWAQEPALPPQSAPKPNTNPWQYSFTYDGYIIPDNIDYGSPVFTADHNWLHLEARYNYENLRTGSLWAGYNFSWGKNLVFDLTPMLGAVFGRTNGIAPGCEASLSYKRFELSVSNEYVITPENRDNSFYYSWPETTFSLTNWLKVGAVAQHTKAYQSAVDVQRGFLVGISHKKWEATTYVFNPDLSSPTIVLEFGIKF